MKKGDTHLARIDGNKREFLKKLALGSAYAVPAMATLSIDSVRSKAFAQGVYVPPAVLGLGFVPAGVISVASSPSNDVVPVPAIAGWYELTFNKPMNPNKGSIACTIDEEACGMTQIDPPPLSLGVSPLSCDTGWFWFSSTKLRLEVSCGVFGNYVAGTSVILLEAITVVLSGYEDTEGNPLEGQTTWSAKYCELSDQCFGD